MEAMRIGRKTVAANWRHLAAWAPWILLACWLGAAAAGFYGFGMVSLSRAKASDAELIRSTEAWFHGAAAPGTATLVMVAGKPCACQSWDKEIAALKSRRPEARVMLVDAAQAPPAAVGLAMVFSAQGRLRYAGPLVDASFCGAGRLAERILARPPQGDDETVYWQPTPACRCNGTQDSNTATKS
jgi:hypothetical protein